MKILIISFFTLVFSSLFQLSWGANLEDFEKKDSIFNEFVQYQLNLLKYNKQKKNIYSLKDSLPIDPSTKSYDFLDSLRNDLAGTKESLFNTIVEKHLQILMKNHPERKSQIDNKSGEFFSLQERVNRIINSDPGGENKGKIIDKSKRTEENSHSQENILKELEQLKNSKKETNLLWVYILILVIIVLIFLLFKKILELEKKVQNPTQPVNVVQKSDESIEKLEGKIRTNSQHILDLNHKVENVLRHTGSVKSNSQNTNVRQGSPVSNVNTSQSDELKYYAKFAEGEKGFNITSLSDTPGPSHFFEIVLKKGGNEGSFGIVENAKSRRNLILRVNDILVPVSEIISMPQNPEAIPQIIERGKLIREGDYLRIVKKLKITFKN